MAESGRVDMSKAGNSILKGAREALAFVRGDTSGHQVHVPDEVDVKLIRKRLGMSQGQFAKAFGMKVSTIQSWEQRRFLPDPAARAYLTVIEREPGAVFRALGVKVNPTKGRKATHSAEL
jgi:putative transcriptional regulator